MKAVADARRADQVLDDRQNRRKADQVARHRERRRRSDLDIQALPAGADGSQKDDRGAGAAIISVAKPIYWLTSGVH